MITIKIKGVGRYRDIINEPHIFLTIPLDENGHIDVGEALNILNDKYQGKIFKELHNKEGEIDPWSRVLFNGRDIRFLEHEKQMLSDGDYLVIMSVLAGG